MSWTLKTKVVYNVDRLQVILLWCAAPPKGFQPRLLLNSMLTSNFGEVLSQFCREFPVFCRTYKIRTLGNLIAVDTPPMVHPS